MKSNLLRIFFEWALIASVLMSAGFFVWYWVESGDLRVSQSQIGGANDHLQRSRMVMGQLEGECEAYAKTNPEFARLLNVLKNGAEAPASTKPAAK